MKVYVIYDAMEIRMVQVTDTMETAMKLAINYITSNGYKVESFNYDEDYTVIEVSDVIRIGGEIIEQEGAITITSTNYLPE